MNSSDSISVLILNDGSAERELLRQYIHSHSDLGVVFECDDLETVKQRVADTSPTLIFLNSEKPGEAALKILDELSNASGLVLILVTGCQESVVRAFDSRALDCIQRPMNKERFDRAINRVREYLRRNEEAELGRWVHGVLKTTINRSERAPQNPATAFLERLTIKDGGRVIFVPTREIDYIEASGNYMAVHTGAKTHLVYETMGDMESQLDPGQFLRIHRSHIVNIRQIRELQPYFNGEYTVLLTTGAKLKISRSYRDRARVALGIA
jgi:two-component system LytT family response regulator